MYIVDGILRAERFALNLLQTGGADLDPKYLQDVSTLNRAGILGHWEDVDLPDRIVNGTLRIMTGNRFVVHSVGGGIGAGFGLTGGQVINDKSGISTSACGKFVRGIVKAVDLGLKAGDTLTQLGEYFFGAAAISEQLGKLQPFDGFQEIYTGKANAQVGQKWAVYQHVYGFIAASLFLDKALPAVVRKRTGAKTGLELADKQLKEDYDQFDHPEKHKGHTREEARQEIADDLAGIEAGTQIRGRYEGKIDSNRLRQNLFGLFCDR